MPEYFPNGGGMGGWKPVGYKPEVPVYAPAQHQTQQVPQQQFQPPLQQLVAYQGIGGGQSQQVLMPSSGMRGSEINMPGSSIRPSQFPVQGSGIRYSQHQVPVTPSGMRLTGPPAQVSGAQGSRGSHHVDVNGAVQAGGYFGGGSGGFCVLQQPSGGIRASQYQQPSGGGVRPSQGQMVAFQPHGPCASKGVRPSNYISGVRASQQPFSTNGPRQSQAGAGFCPSQANPMGLGSGRHLQAPAQQQGGSRAPSGLRNVVAAQDGAPGRGVQVPASSIRPPRSNGQYASQGGRR